MSKQPQAPEIRKTCFVVGPIGDDGSITRRNADWLLKGIIRPVFEEHFPHYQVVRSDNITAPGMIDVQMINHLFEADLVIADMSERNPNAFYEMGIRHAVRKPIVHMFAEGTVIPFDVAPYRAIKFSIERFEDVEVAKRELSAVVAEVSKEDFKVENPVTRARSFQAIEDKGSPEIQVLFEEIADIRRRLDLRGSRSPKLSHSDFVTLLVRTDKTRELFEILRRDTFSPAGLKVNHAQTSRAGDTVEIEVHGAARDDIELAIFIEDLKRASGVREVVIAN